MGETGSSVWRVQMGKLGKIMSVTLRPGRTVLMSCVSPAPLEIPFIRGDQVTKCKYFIEMKIL